MNPHRKCFSSYNGRGISDDGGQRTEGGRGEEQGAEGKEARRLGSLEAQESFEVGGWRSERHGA